ncbi:MAG: RNA polymerase sigma factor FliA [Deltaproteobacteria bacterium]|nr:RNA polymerase sigma factor FliA [Deltaproteobacteria bacterium]
MTNPYAAMQAYKTKTREEAVVEFAPLVKRIATRLTARMPAKVEIDDLIQAGMIGLLDAIEKYDAGHAAQFRTYAEFRIRGAMLDELRSNDWVPRSVRDAGSRMSKSHRELLNELGRNPTDGEMAKKLDLPINEYHDLLLKSRAIPLINLEDIQPHANDEDAANFFDVLEDPACKNPLDELSLRDVAGRIAQAIDTLPEKERLVLSLYYDEDLNLKEIGEVLGLTESRVSQLRTQSIVRIRSLLAEAVSPDLLDKLLSKRES